MIETSLAKELERLDEDEFRQLLKFWGLSTDLVENREQSFQLIIEQSQDRFHLRNSLEQLTRIELKILLYVASFSDGCTLGEVSRKLFIPPQTLEVELLRLWHYGFLYLRRNRERLTNFRDKYYLFDHLQGKIDIPIREGRENYLFRDAQSLFTQPPEADYYQKENIERIIADLPPEIIQVIEKAFVNGGALTINKFKDICWEHTEEYLHFIENNYLGMEVVFFEEEYFRFLTLPTELLTIWGDFYYRSPRGYGAQLQYMGYDFILNLKKTIFFIQSKGAVLTQAMRLKLSDSRRLLQGLTSAKLDPISPVKLIDQLDFIFPILRLLELIDTKDFRLILTEKFADYIGQKPGKLLKEIIGLIFEKGDKINKNPNIESIYRPESIPFFNEDDFNLVYSLLDENEGRGLTFLLMQYLQEKVYRHPNFPMTMFHNQVMANSRRFVNTLFYMFLFGLVTYEKKENDIYVSISRIGSHYIHDTMEDLEENFYSACLFFNPDLTIIVDKNLASEMVLYIMKAFTRVDDENQVLTLSLNRDTFQQGVMTGFAPTVFTDTILHCFKTPLPQNVEYFLQEWSKNIQIASIVRKIIVKVDDKDVLDNLIQQPKLKGVFEDRLGDLAAIVVDGQEQNLIAAAEKLNIIIKLYV